MRPLLLALAALAALAVAAPAPAGAQAIIQSGPAVVYAPGTGPLSAYIGPFGDLTLAAPPRPGGPYVYNAREQTLTGPGFQFFTIPGFTGGPLNDPVYVLGF